MSKIAAKNQMKTTSFDRRVAYLRSALSGTSCVVIPNFVKAEVLPSGYTVDITFRTTALSYAPNYPVIVCFGPGMYTCPLCMTVRQYNGVYGVVGCYSIGKIDKILLGFKVGEFNHVQIKFNDKTAYFYAPDGSSVGGNYATELDFKDIMLFTDSGSHGVPAHDLSISKFTATETASGKTVVDLIPVEKSSVGYFYDRVSGKMHGNIGNTPLEIVG